MARLRPKLATRAGVKLGLISRTKVLANALKYTVTEISQGLNVGEADFADLVVKIEKWISLKLVRIITLNFYQNNVIRARVTFEIDWEEHDTEIALNISVFEEGGAEEKQVYTSISGFAQALRERISALDQEIGIDEFVWTTCITSDAISHYGENEARRLAGTRKATSEELDHWNSFTSNENLHIQPDDLKEVILLYEEGTSTPKPG